MGPTYGSMIYTIEILVRNWGFDNLHHGNIGVHNLGVQFLDPPRALGRATFPKAPCINILK